jgi:xylulokinase
MNQFPHRMVLCADMGTSSLKAALIDFDGRLTAFVREPYPTEKVLHGTVEASDWSGALRRATRALTRYATQGELRVSALCVSGNGPTLVPVTKEDGDLPPLHWYDNRTAAPQTGVPRDEIPSLFLPHAAWFAQNEPDRYGKTRWFLSSQEWLSFRLGAEPVTVLPSRAYEPFYYDARQIGAFGLDPAKFPAQVLQGTVIGRVSPAASQAFGLAAGIPIIAGGPDFIMALIGSGVIRNGMVCDRSGTSEGINFCTDRPAHTPELRTLPHVRPGLWNVGVMLPTTGRLFEWFRSITGQQSRDYRDLLAEIIQAPPGGLFFPDLRSAGKLSAASAFFSTAGLTTRSELGRAVVEAIGYMVRNAIDTLERHGYRIEGMRISGGQAKNPLWNQLKADITGRCLTLPAIADGELAGNACLALTALGEATDLEAAVAQVVRIERVFEPDQRAYADYCERYDSYRSTLKKMEKFFE